MDIAIRRNRHGLVVGAVAARASGTAEREAALTPLDRHRTGRRRVTLGADKAYDVADFIKELRSRPVTPHVAVNGAASKLGRVRRALLDGRTLRHPGYAQSASATASASKRYSAGSRRMRACQGQGPRPREGRRRLLDHGRRLQPAAPRRTGGHGTMTVSKRHPPPVTGPRVSPRQKREHQPMPSRRDALHLLQQPGRGFSAAVEPTVETSRSGFSPTRWFHLLGSRPRGGAERRSAIRRPGAAGVGSRDRRSAPGRARRPTVATRPPRGRSQPRLTSRNSMRTRPTSSPVVASSW